MHRLFYTIVLFLLPFTGVAQIPTYYSNIDFTKSGDALKLELASLVVSTHSTPLYYTSSFMPDTWDALKISDLQDGDTANVLLVYGYDDLDNITKNDRTRNKALSCHTSGCNGLWNREHVYPQSLSNPSMTTQFPGTGTDVHNLRAADGQENSARGNDVYASGSGNASNLSSSSYYPGDEWRGDVARIIMYMYLRYNSECPALNVGAGSASYALGNDMPNIFLDWNAQDPPSQYEKNRNSIFHSMQGNRNPFIDNPYLATRIWNGPTALSTWGPLSTPDVISNSAFVYPSITHGMVYINKSSSLPLNYSIYNSVGSLVETGLYEKAIDLSAESKGVYFIKFSDKPATSILLQ